MEKKEVAAKVRICVDDVQSPVDMAAASTYVDSKMFKDSDGVLYPTERRELTLDGIGTELTGESSVGFWTWVLNLAKMTE